MAVLLETSKGDIVIDLFVDDCPLASKNFVKLCKIKYYNNCLFHNVQQNFIAQTGDPTNTGKGGSSIYGVMYGDQARFFESEVRKHLKHTKKGMVGMVAGADGQNASQFYITLGDSLDSLDGRYTLFGQVSEGGEVLEAINDAYCDEAGRPYQNIRIRHTFLLVDPFDDPPQLLEHVPDASPPPAFADEADRLEEDWVPGQDTRDPEEVERVDRANEAKNRAVVLEMIGDLPEADVAPPANMLFLAKLNPVTTEEDLEIIFGRFGEITSCDIIRDWKTGDSLCYGFIGFDNETSCEEAYFKMNNVLIDDRRIKVDFSQSVHHLWKQFRRFGRKGGNADSAAAAEQHKRDGGGRGQRLQLKEGMGGMPQLPRGGGRGGGGGGGSYGLLLDEGPTLQHRGQAASRDQRGAGPRDQGIGRAADEQFRGEREREHRAGRDESRRRERRDKAEGREGRGEAERRDKAESREGRDRGESREKRDSREERRLDADQERDRKRRRSRSRKRQKRDERRSAGRDERRESGRSQHGSVREDGRRGGERRREDRERDRDAV